MNKQEILAQLRKGLPNGINERMTYYSEMVDDRMEDGISEETAVSELGTVNKLVSQIIANIPLKNLIKEKMTAKKKLNAWDTVRIILGCPIYYVI